MGPRRWDGSSGSTSELEGSYYQLINEGVKKALGGLHSAKCLLSSVDFQEIESCQSSGNWDRSAEILGDAAVSLERAGADFLLICTNTMHKVAPQVQARVDIPLLHIAEATADELEGSGIQTVGLLGTRYTMLQTFYKQRLTTRGIQVLIPEEADIELVNHVIFNELCLGVVSDASRREFQRVIGTLKDRGAQGVILGCTEIGLLIRQSDTPVSLFDTTILHASKAVECALGR